jgi:DNA-binding MarR family transcriptional regulator
VVAVSAVAVHRAWSASKGLRARSTERWLQRGDSTVAALFIVGFIPARRRALRRLLWRAVPLRRQLGLTGPAILQSVDRLEAGGLVERRRDAADRRSYALETTARGQATLERARTAIADVTSQFGSVLGGESQRQELDRVLRKLLAKQ